MTETNKRLRNIENTLGNIEIEIKYIKKKVNSNEKHLQKLNGSVKETHETSIKNKEKIDDHLREHRQFYAKVGTIAGVIGGVGGLILNVIFRVMGV